MYTLEADLYRDMMPKVGPGATPRNGIGGIVRLRAAVESDLPDGLQAEAVWLLNGAEQWEAAWSPLQTFAVDRRYHLQLSVRDGPTWDVGTRVDVVLRFSVGGRVYFVARHGVAVIGAF